jgi:hypothetical protein
MHKQQKDIGLVEKMMVRMPDSGKLRSGFETAFYTRVLLVHPVRKAYVQVVLSCVLMLARKAEIA